MYSSLASSRVKPCRAAQASNLARASGSWDPALAATPGRSNARQSWTKTTRRARMGPWAAHARRARTSVPRLARAFRRLLLQAVERKFVLALERREVQRFGKRHRGRKLGVQVAHRGTNDAPLPLRSFPLQHEFSGPGRTQRPVACHVEAGAGRVACAVAVLEPEGAAACHARSPAGARHRCGRRLRGTGCYSLAGEFPRLARHAGGPQGAQSGPPMWADGVLAFWRYASPHSRPRTMWSTPPVC